MIRNLIYRVALLWLGISGLRAQTSASLTVRYMLNYDESLKTYTAWVVPNYNTPNENNLGPEEKGATAQFTLRVPKGFVLGNIRDIRGNWDKQPGRISTEGPMIEAGADARFDYYIIGKAPAETNYGEFRQGEPIALFSFTGSGATPSEVSVLESNDPFVELASKQFALNVSNSFYSRSGQYRSMVATPGEQFTAPTRIKEVLTELAQKVKTEVGSNPNAEFNADMQLIAYPNPVVSLLNVHYFSFREKEKVAVELVDMEGDVRTKANFIASHGVNKLQVPVDHLITGVYLVRMKLENEVVNRKILKIN